MSGVVQQTERRKGQGQRLWTVVAVALVGGVVLGRVWAAAIGDDEITAAGELLSGLRVELRRRPVDLAALDIPLERQRADGSLTTTRVLGRAMQDNDVVLLNFWATWCPPCLQELGSLFELGARFTGRGLRILAVSYDDDWGAQHEAWRRVLGTERPGVVQWLRDPAGQDGDPRSMMRLRLGTEKLPETWVIVRGEIVARFIGDMEWTDPKLIAYFNALTGGRP